MTDSCQKFVGKRLGYALKAAQNALRTRMDADLKGLDLTASTYAALAIIEKNPGISNAELARASFVAPQSMQGILSSLLDRKLVKRNNDPDHGRILKTRLTSKGKMLVSRAHAIVTDIENDMVKGLTRAQELNAFRLLVNCAANLKN